MRNEKSNSIILNKSEHKFNYIRAPGPGGQNVNKVASAVQLRVNILHSPSLNADVKKRLIKIAASKITHHGELIIKANRFRTQERNKQDAVNRLQELLKHAATPPKKRKKTKPTQLSQEKRLVQKKLHSKIKILRRNKPHHEE
jgi:ribosome-associated protein